MSPQSQQNEHMQPAAEQAIARYETNEIPENERRKHMSRYDFTGLGQMAVETDLLQIEFPFEADHPVEIETAADLKKELQEARTVLDDASREAGNNKALQQLLHLAPMSPWLQRTLAIDTDHVLESLTQKTETGEPLINDEALLNFLQWHNHALALTQENFEKELPAYTQWFERRFIDNIHQGVLPESAQTNLRKLQAVDVIVDDGFRTTTKHTHGSAYYSERLRRWQVLLAPGSIEDESTLTHEFLHVVAGEHGSAAEETGLRTIFGTNSGGIGLDEALTEHIADSLLHGMVEVTDPLDPRRHRDMAYFSERCLLDALVNHGVQPVDIRLFINAFFENKPRGADAALIDALHQAFPFTDVVADIRNLQQSPDQESVPTIQSYAHNLSMQAIPGRAAVRR